MEKELDPDVIKATQTSLGKYVKRPPLTEKLLKKPPFRFLHDIVTTVIKTTGFFEGLFENEELISDNVKDRDSKILFLNKIITVLGTVTGSALTVKPSKIVAGQEPEKTNELLQCLASALDAKLSSDEAVNKYKEEINSTVPVENKSKESVKAVKKTNDAKKITAKGSEKLLSNKKDPNEKSLTKNDKEKIKNVKQKELSQAKKDSPPKKPSAQSKTLTKKNSIEKIPQNQSDNATDKRKKIGSTNSGSINEKKPNRNGKNEEESQVVTGTEKHDNTDSNILIQQSAKNNDDDPTGSTELEKLNSSYTIGDNDLNSSLCSQDLMEVDNENAGEKNCENYRKKEYKDKINISTDIISIEQRQEYDNIKEIPDHLKTQSTNGSGPPSLNKVVDMEIQNETVTNVIKHNTAQKVVRPPSVRPSSSRPGAPRFREKHDNVVTGNENLLVGKVNIIVENSPNEEEEDSSIVIVEPQHDDALTTSQGTQELELSSNQHGALVQQILDSQKEYSQNAGKTEIEWQFGAQKAREAVNQEIEQLRYNIQALSRVANPLGKILDHIQEDVEIMRQELQQWTTSYEDASKELRKQKTANEDSLLPLHTKLKQLDVDIEEKRDKINDLKVVIHKNSSRIEKLLASGDLQ